MIALYGNIRSSTGSCDTMPSMPMYEYELIPAIQSLEFLKQSLESYLNELSKRFQNNLQLSNDDEQQSKSGIENDDDDIRDSALDTFSETSSLIESTNFSKQLITPNLKLMNILEVRSSASSDDKKPVNSSSSSSSPSSNHSDARKENNQLSNSNLIKVEELNPHFISLSSQNVQIDRQISDEGYRSVRNEQQQPQQQKTLTSTSSNNNLPLLTRSKSYDSTEKVDQWLSNATSQTSSMPISLGYNNNFQV